MHPKLTHPFSSSFASYSALEQQSAGLSADGYARLLRALCSDFPTHIVPFVFASLKKPTSERLSFEEFSAGIHAVLLYEGTLHTCCCCWLRERTPHRLCTLCRVLS